MYRSPFEVVIALVTGQFKIIQIGLGTGSIPIMIAERREEAIYFCPSAVSALVGIDELVIKLADILVDRGCLACGVIIVPGSFTF